MVTINFIYKWEKVNTIFMDLSKMFDTLIRDLLLAKLNAHGVFFQCDKIGLNLFVGTFS